MYKIILVSAVAALAIGSSASAANLVANGDFSGGNTGFSSTYAYNGGSPTQGSYFLLTNPSSLCGCFVSIGDHTTGSGEMLMLDGAGSGGSFWSETLSVVPNQTYDLNLWATNIGTGGPSADIVATVDGTQLLDSGSLPYSTGETATTWNQFQASFNSGAATSVTLNLYDTDLQYAYNDFAVDDVSLTGPAPASGTPEPATWSLMIAGLLGVGAALRARRSVTPQLA